MIVPEAPQSWLQRKYVLEIRDQQFRIKVVEKSGKTLKQMLQRSDPFMPSKCAKVSCFMCQSDERGPYTRHGVTIDIQCQGCG